jgi:hypothetical protein
MQYKLDVKRVQNPTFYLTVTAQLQDMVLAGFMKCLVQSMKVHFSELWIKCVAIQ